MLGMNSDKHSPKDVFRKLFIQDLDDVLRGVATSSARINQVVSVQVGGECVSFSVLSSTAHFAARRGDGRGTAAQQDTIIAALRQQNDPAQPWLQPWLQRCALDHVENLYHSDSYMCSIVRSAAKRGLVCHTLFFFF